MGYSTYYQLDVVDDSVDIFSILSNEEMLEKIGFSGVNYAIDEYGYGIDCVSWYGYDEEMKELSKEYPEIVFELCGEGEDPGGDLWKAYYKGGKGKKYQAIITYPEFSENDLE